MRKSPPWRPASIELDASCRISRRRSPRRRVSGSSRPVGGDHRRRGYTRLAAPDHDQAKTKLKAWFGAGGSLDHWRRSKTLVHHPARRGGLTPYRAHDGCPGRPSGARPVLFTPAAVSFSYVCRKENLNDKQGSRSGPGGSFPGWGFWHKPHVRHHPLTPVAFADPSLPSNTWTTAVSSTPPAPRHQDKSSTKRRIDRGGEDWVRFAKNLAVGLTASALAASEGAHLVRHRSRRRIPGPR